MPSTPLLRRSAVVAAVLALAGAAGAEASRDRDDDRGKQRSDSSRMLYATTDQNLLVQFNERSPERLEDVRVISGLPDGITLRGIDFRPATGGVYGVGSDNVVYRVNPQTGIAVLEGPAFTPGLLGNSFGVDFNPTVDKIRVVSDAAENLRLNVDEGTLLSTDKNLNPGTPQVVGAGYTNSSFSADKPDATQLFVVDAATDQLFLQNLPNDGTLTMGKRLARRRRAADRVRHRRRGQHRLPRHLDPALARLEPLPGRRDDRQDAPARPHRRQAAGGHRPGRLAGLKPGGARTAPPRISASGAVPGALSSAAS